LSAAEYREQLCRIIDDHCFAIEVFQRAENSPRVAYTVGCTARTKPELIITGMAEHRAVAALRHLGRHLLHTNQVHWRPGDHLEIPLSDTPRTLFELVRVQVPDAHLESAALVYGSDIRALQLVHADRRGRWPWDKSWRGSDGRQPVLGPRSPHAT
jgi:hypothetical protein